MSTKIITEDGIKYDVMEDLNGYKCWYYKDDIHRTNGPALEHPNGYKAWCKYGLYHREDGPARILSNGEKEYWLNGEHYPNISSDDEWIIFNIII